MRTEHGLTGGNVKVGSDTRSLGRGHVAEPVVGEPGEATSLPVLCLLLPGAGFAGPTAEHPPCCLFLSDLGRLLHVCLPAGLFSGMGVPINAAGQPRALRQCSGQ